MKFIPRWRLRKPAEDEKTVYVSERHGVRQLHIGSDTIQSAMRIARPFDLELAYTRSMMGFLLFRPVPRRVLLVGLGGGSLAKFIRHYFPESLCEAVEIDPQVLTVARQCFLLPDDDPGLSVSIGDGAEFVAQAGIQYDAIMVDGYEAESPAEALTSTAFYRDCHERLSDGGILVVNLWSGERAFNETLVRIETAFPDGTLCLPARKPGNVSVFAFRGVSGSFEWARLESEAAVLAARCGLDFPDFVAALRKMNRHDDHRLYLRPCA
jgi:spermidine synthase